MSSLKATLKIMVDPSVPNDKFHYELLTKLFSNVAELFQINLHDSNL
jgi:hypothetical protein